MPIVTVRLLPGATHDQKRAVVKGITDVLQSTLDKKRDSIHVLFEEVDPENWGIAGDTIASYRS